MKQLRTFAFGAATAQGSWPVQEDGYFADPGTGVFALADGFGGRGNGDLAAKQALAEVRAAGSERSAREGSLFSPAQAAHRDLFGEINKKLLAWNEKRAPGTRGGCSLILATVERTREIAITGCGACGAMLLRAGSFIPLLSPQSPPRETPAAPLFPLSALGLGREVGVESRTFLWQPQDLVLLFSSGLAWERDGFATELLAQLALREPGSDLGAFVSLATAGVESPWNQTMIAVEAL
ncbi:MAG: PP2C family protein-serine/threonine phosphatase [Bdellovibrionota bacterium]